jgi:hypothetical protein
VTTKDVLHQLTYELPEASRPPSSSTSALSEVTPCCLPPNLRLRMTRS